MAVDFGSVNVMIPGRYGVSIVDLSMLVDALLDEDTEDLQAAIDNAAFDELSSTMAPKTEQHLAAIVDKIERLRKLNADGDSDAYWDME